MSQERNLVIESEQKQWEHIKCTVASLEAFQWSNLRQVKRQINKDKHGLYVEQNRNR